jgi:hypothetical protein
MALTVGKARINEVSQNALVTQQCRIAALIHERPRQHLSLPLDGSTIYSTSTSAKQTIFCLINHRVLPHSTRRQFGTEKLLTTNTSSSPKSISFVCVDSGDPERREKEEILKRRTFQL